ncbi:Abi family protein [Neobacillus sp. SCS-31]|uniref:Abi family protein n=1 Tax=Neobacillus oceani TaxID=3115292 RepID=UPI003905A8F9
MVKKTDGLMKYLRDTHGIQINGSHQKQKLRNIGYYHGFKGYRFIKQPNRRIIFTDFNEIMALNKFDMELKTLFYPQMMFIETALKNYMLEVIVKHARTDSFDQVYENHLTYYKTHHIGSDDYKKALQNRLKLRNQFYSVLSRDYLLGKPIVQHFYHKDEYVPIWAIFEVISLGEFGNFIACSNINMKRDISNLLKINIAFDTDGRMTEIITFLLKDLRNALAHNEAIFDTRFKRSRINGTLCRLINNETSIPNITFETIVDYLILTVYLLKNLGVTKTELHQLVRKFENIINDFRAEIPFTVYSRILYTNTVTKLNLLKNFI